MLQCEAITDIDVTAADMLKDLDRELNERGIHMAFVELRTRLQERVETYGLLSELDRKHFFAKMKPALRDIDAHDPDSDDVAAPLGRGSRSRRPRRRGGPAAPGTAGRAAGLTPAGDSGVDAHGRPSTTRHKPQSPLSPAARAAGE